MMPSFVQREDEEEPPVEGGGHSAGQTGTGDSDTSKVLESESKEEEEEQEAEIGVPPAKSTRVQMEGQSPSKPPAKPPRPGKPGPASRREEKRTTQDHARPRRRTRALRLGQRGRQSGRLSAGYFGWVSSQVLVVINATPLRDSRMP